MPASPFISDSQFINSCAQSTAVAWSLGKATKLFDVHVFFISMTFISIYRHRFGDFWSIYEALWWALQNTIMLSTFLGSMNFSILTMIFSVKYCKTFFLLIHQKSSKINGAHLRPGDLSYYSLCHNNNTFRVWSSLFL